MLTKKQLEAIEQVIRRRMLTFTVETLGTDALSSSEIKELQDAGLLRTSVKNLIGDSYTIGKVVALIDKTKAASLGFDDIMAMAKKMPQTDVERRAILYAQNHAGQYIRGITSDMVKEIRAGSAKNSLDLLREKVSENITNRKTVSQLKSDLYHAIDNRGRDWRRIAATEVQNAIQTAIYHEIKESSEDGEDQLCYKRPTPRACKHCKRLYLSDGVPRIFRLKDLATSNYGKKVGSWTPCVEATHPYCQCQLIMLPKNHGFEKRRVASEQFEHDGKTYKKGQLISEDEYSELPKTLRSKTGWDAIQVYTGEEAEPEVAKSMSFHAASDEEGECVCEY